MRSNGVTPAEWNVFKSSWKQFVSEEPSQIRYTLRKSGFFYSRNQLLKLLEPYFKLFKLCNGFKMNECFEMLSHSVFKLLKLGVRQSCSLEALGLEDMRGQKSTFISCPRVPRKPDESRGSQILDQYRARGNSRILVHPRIGVLGHDCLRPNWNYWNNLVSCFEETQLKSQLV